MTDISANGSLPDQIQQLLDCNHQQLVLAESCTAGLAASRLGGVPGISRNFCGSSVVYQEGTKQDWLDISESLLESEGAVSEPVARQMALNSLQQTGTATLATSITGHLGPGAPAELDGQVFVGVALREKSGQLPTTLVVQRRLEPAGREQRQQQAADLLLETVLRVLQVLDACRQLEQGGGRWPVVPIQGQGLSDKVIFPGAFNPMHAGHRKIIQVAEQLTGRTVALEISLENVDKPVLSTAAALCRIIPLMDQAVWITRAPTFVEKAGLFPGSTFLTGVDTIARISQPRYYEGSSLTWEKALETIRESDCRFLVFGRLMDSHFQTGGGGEAAQFLGLGDLEVPPSLGEICEAVSEKQFREDITSRELRPPPQDG
ncbi:MAG: CinA family protein [Planctomycetota bacterium]|nr:CinA family protein [Planctomycetota bacterium]